jgi:hypothetical protein
MCRPAGKNRCFSHFLKKNPIYFSLNNFLDCFNMINLIMKKLSSRKSAILLCTITALIIFFPLACKRDTIPLTQQTENLSSKVANIKNWWETRKTVSAQNQTEILSRIPDSMTIQTYWQSQFQNGIPKWSDARVLTVNDETIYEIPFQFPDDLVFLNDKPDAPFQYYLTGKAGSAQSI